MIINIKRDPKSQRREGLEQERSDVAGSDVALKATSGVVDSGWGAERDQDTHLDAKFSLERKMRGFEIDLRCRPGKSARSCLSRCALPWGIVL